MRRKVEERKRGLVLGMERAVRVGLSLHGLELAASVRVNRIGMLLQGQRNQHQLPLIQKP